MSFSIDPYIVYVKVNKSNHIVSVNSSAFLTDLSEWIQIDSGFGDKYHHAQGNYFVLPIITNGGAYRYKLVDGVPVECTPQEITEQEEALKPNPTVSPDKRISDLEENLSILLGIDA